MTETQDNFQFYQISPFCIGRGATGAVFRVNSENVAKIPRYYCDGNFSRYSGDPRQIRAAWLNALEKELQIHQEIYKVCIRVPKPIGIYEIRILSFIEPFSAFRVYPAIIMQFIDGSRIDDLVQKEYEQASASYHLEIEKAKKLGFQVSDGQGLWNRREKQTYLIDFEYWKFRDK